MPTDWAWEPLIPYRWDSFNLHLWTDSLPAPWEGQDGPFYVTLRGHRVHYLFLDEVDHYPGEED